MSSKVMDVETTCKNRDLTLGYLVPVFPTQTHIFFWREICALRDLGVRVVLYSTTRPSADECRHDFAPSATLETNYLFPVALNDVLWLCCRPIKLMAACRYVFGLAETPLRKRTMLLGMILCATMLVRSARREGVHHVHIHSCANAAHIGSIANLLDALPYSLTLHGDLPVYGSDHLAKMQRAKFVACVTKPLQDQVSDIGIARDRLPVLWMGVDVDRFRKYPLRSPEAGKLRAITVARLSRPKGHDFALKALKVLKDAGVRISYCIAGEGPYRKEIELEVAAQKLTGDVTFSGTVSEVDVAKLLAQSDVFVLCSVGLGEAAPVAVMEAMASGLPVIVSVIGGTPDMIEDGIDGYLCAQEDIDAISARLMQLAGDIDLRLKMGANARDKALREFDARSLAARLLNQILVRA
jgi:colanic acid/amylovoran biosynthesis glycosyltransferase